MVLIAGNFHYDNESTIMKIPLRKKNIIFSFKTRTCNFSRNLAIPIHQRGFPTTSFYGILIGHPLNDWLRGYTTTGVPTYTLLRRHWVSPLIVMVHPSFDAQSYNFSLSCICHSNMVCREKSLQIGFSSKLPLHLLTPSLSSVQCYLGNSGTAYLQQIKWLILRTICV